MKIAAQYIYKQEAMLETVKHKTKTWQQFVELSERLNWIHTTENSPNPKGLFARILAVIVPDKYLKSSRYDDVK